MTQPHSQLSTSQEVGRGGGGNPPAEGGGRAVTIDTES